MPVVYGVSPYGSSLYGTDGTISVFIGGNPVFVVAGSLSINSTIGKRSTASFTVKTDTSTHFQQYQQVSIYDKRGALTFSGYISSPKETKLGFQPVLEHTITCVDQHFLADKRVVAATYTGKSYGFIVNDIYTNILAAEGVTIGQIYDSTAITDLFPNTTVFPSLTLYPTENTGILPTATFVYCTVAQAFDELVKVASAAGVLYYWQIDQFKKLWFVPYTAVVNSVLVDGTQIDHKYNPPTLTRANPAYGNTQYLLGGMTQTVTQTEIQVGDGQKTAFTMGYALASAPTISINLNGAGYVAQSVGIKGTSGSQWYWAQGDPIISQDSSGTKLRGPNAPIDLLKVVYVGQYPTTIIDQNNAQISYEANLDGSTGIVEMVATDNNITSLANGLAKTGQLLTLYAQQGSQLVFQTLQTGFQQGQLVTVPLPDYALYNAQMLIENVSAADTLDGYNIWYTVTAVLGPFDITWVDFFSKLLKQQAPTNSINVGTGQSIVIAVSGSITFSPTVTGSATVFACPVPSTSLFPDVTVFPC